MRFKKKYLYVALSLGCLIVINQLIIQYILLQKREDAKLMNIAGRQRMLSQRVNLMAYRVYQNDQYTPKDRLKLVLEDWKKAHLALINGDNQINMAKIECKRIATKFKESFKKIEEIESLLRKAPTVSKADMEKISTITDLFLEEMEIIVAELEDLSTKKLYTIIFIELLIAFVSLLFIYFEFKKVIFPILKKIDNDFVIKQLQFEELQRTKSKLKAILDSTTDINVLISPDYKILSFNKKANEFSKIAWGKPLEESADIWAYIFPNDREDFYRDTQKAFNGEHLKFEREIFFQQFSVWFQVAYFPVFDSEGKIIGITFNTTNINERKKADIKLQQSETMLKALYDSSSEASSFIDKNFRILFTNKLAKEICKNIFGKEPQIGDKCLDYIVPAFKSEFADYHQRVLKGESIYVEKEYAGLCWAFSLRPVYDSENNIVGISDNVKDITVSKASELQIKESEQRLQKTIEAIPHPLIIVNEQMDITYTNDEFEKVFGYTPQEAIGKNIDFLIPERYQKEHLQYENQYLKKGNKLLRKMSDGVLGITKSKQEINLIINLNTFTVGAEKFILVILEDITEFKKRQAIITHQNETLQQIAWQQSHKVRRPVATILGLCGLLKNDQTATEEEKHKYLDYLLQATKELDEVIHKIVAESNRGEYLQGK